jgi:hypothetical protein
VKSLASFAAPFTLSLLGREQNRRNRGRVKRYWEIIADNLKKRGWSSGYVSAGDSEGRTIWIVDAHRDDGNRFVVHAEERLTAFLELESLVRNEKRKEGKPKQSLLSLRKVRSGSGQARTARRDIPRDRPQA